MYERSLQGVFVGYSLRLLVVKMLRERGRPVVNKLFDRKASCWNLSFIFLFFEEPMAILWRAFVVCALLMLEAEPGLDNCTC